MAKRIVLLAALFVNLLLVESFPKNPHRIPGHRTKVIGPPGLSNSLFHNLHCKGTYNIFALALAERVCDDCYDLYQEIDLMAYCRGHCFQNVVFKLCLKATVLHEDSRLEYSHAAETLSKGEHPQ